MMLTRRGFLAGAAGHLGWALSGAGPARAADSVVSVADFGAHPDGSDASPGITAALRAAMTTPSRTLSFPQGSYSLRRPDKVAILVRSARNLVIEGNGSTLLFVEDVLPFIAEDCSGLVVRNLTFQPQRTFTVTGEIEQIGGAGITCRLRLSHGGPADFGTQIGRFGAYDLRTGLLAVGGLDTAKVVSSFRFIADDRLELTFTAPLPLAPGMTLVMRSGGGKHCFNLHRCDDFRLQGVTIASSSGMGITAERCRSGTIEGLTVAPPANSARLLSTNADAIHFRACRGAITIQDSSFFGMGDDAINVNTSFFALRKVPGDASSLGLIDKNGQPPSPGVWPKVGDRLSFYAPTNLKVLQAGTVTGVGAAGPGTVALDTDVGGLPDDAIVSDASDDSTLEIRSCHFRGNRARGVLAHSNVRIEGCAFSGQSSAAILMAADLNWLEGPFVRNVEIKNNVIADVNTTDLAGAAVVIGAFPAGKKPFAENSLAVVNGNVRVTGNQITARRTPALYAANIAGLAISGNTFAGSTSPVLSVVRSSEVAVDGNSFPSGGTISLGDVDQGSLRIGRNVGLTMP